MPDYGIPPRFRAIAEYIEKERPDTLGKVEPYIHTPVCDDPDSLPVIPAFPSLIPTLKKKTKRAHIPARISLAQKYGWQRFGGGR